MGSGVLLLFGVSQKVRGEGEMMNLWQGSPCKIDTHYKNFSPSKQKTL